MKRLLAPLALLFALPVHADWQLDPGRSNVQATLTQLGGASPQTHHHQVNNLQGSISPEGTLRLPLKLSQTDLLSRLGELPPWATLLTNTTLVTLVAQMSPSKLDGLDIGDSFVEPLTFRVQAEGLNREETVPLRFTREGLNEVRVTHAEPMVMDGQALMANPTVRTVMSLLGYQQIGDEVPVTLDARLVNQ